MEERLARFAALLAAQGFGGELESSAGARQVAATDNSIYQVVPQAIVYPANARDVRRIVRAAGESDPLALIARGGATGTNGQSLGSGVIVDFARHMNRILHIDLQAMTVVVEPGVVLGQLNAALAAHGLFFPPNVSTASRATLGGMVATDASGKGSRRYGKTSDYILALDVVLADGNAWRIEPMSRAQAERIARGRGPVADLHRETLAAVTGHAAAIERVFPVMNRGLTGYNLQKTYDAAADRFSLTYLLAGSEGTLALTEAITLRVVPKPGHRALAVVSYQTFAQGLEDVGNLLAADPLAVEILDDKVIGAARSDIVWETIGSVLGDVAGEQVKALNFIEFSGMTDDAVEAGLARLEAIAQTPAPGRLGVKVIREGAVIDMLWSLREKAVGLLARLGGNRQGMPFVEDTAVPPENLPAYVAQFRALLDSHGLHYGMFGHADVGCLHVRPFLDMRNEAQAALVRPISDAVARLTRDHGGLLWGEHGRGYRGEYSPFFFGPALYPLLERIKTAADPRNLFNPGKLAAPQGAPPVRKIDAVPLRGQADAAIPEALIAEFDRAVACNGNGACQSWDALDTLCPSYKATRDRAQSPRGRAALLRAWSGLGPDDTGRDAIEQETKRALDSCLSCKACTTLCPVKVDVPTMKSRFMAQYYARHPRPAAHWLLAMAEAGFALGRRVPRLANAVMGSPLTARAMRRVAGMVDLPRFSLARAGLPPVVTLAALGDGARTVVLVEDSFIASFDSVTLIAAARVLQAMGYRVLRLPARTNGKMLHLLGLRDAFTRIAASRVTELREIAQSGAQLVGLDAAMALMFEQEYAEVLPDVPFALRGLEEVLAEAIEQGHVPPAMTKSGPAYRLFGHCTESALRPRTLARWTQVLGHFGLPVEVMRSGCCGMAGLFGHQQANLALSQRLFDLSWRKPVEQASGGILATGYSCRSQVARFTATRARHPIEALAQHLAGV